MILRRSTVRIPQRTVSLTKASGAPSYYDAALEVAIATRTLYLGNLRVLTGKNTGLPQSPVRVASPSLRDEDGTARVRVDLAVEWGSRVIWRTRTEDSDSGM
jgi:hypothetical protein